MRRARWWVYQDAERQIWSGQGYASGESFDTFTLINPVSIAVFDRNGQVLESIQATRASTSGALDPDDEFPQSSYVRWTTNQFTDCCFLSSTRVYHTIPESGEGSSGTNYDQTDFGYDSSKRRNRQVTPGGTITRTVFDARGNVVKVYIGTDDTGATSSDPTGGGAEGNNMVLVTESEFDGGQDGGDNNLTKQTQHVDGSTTRVTSFLFDWRDRRTDTDGEVDFYEQTFYDNLDRVIKTDRRDTTANGNLIARSETKFDDRGRVYRTIQYGVNPSNGSVGNALTSITWFDAANNVIKQHPAGAKQFIKTSYDGLGRQIKQSQGYDLDETSYSEASSISDDTIIEQSIPSYDAASNVIRTEHRQRYHNATGTGDLNDPSGVQPKSRISYSATWPDALGRTQATANYGTNGGSSLSRPSTIPSRSDTVLVTSLTYNSAGNTVGQTKPNGVTTCFEFDAAGRQTTVIQNCTGSDSSSSSSSSSSSGGCTASDDENVTVITAYNSDGNVSSITAVNSTTGNQTTEYVYGTTLSDSDIASSLLKRKEIYPDSVDNDDVIGFKYNRQGEVKEIRDQNGTVHSFDFDKVGRQTQDRVTTLGTGVDGAVRRIATSYEVRGMREKITSWNGETVGSGSVVNEVQFSYNDFRQLTDDYQNQGGTVNTSTTPKVQYGYADGSSNTIRPTSLTYPNGRELTFFYGEADSLSDALSRIDGIVDDDAGATHLADYSYLGLGTFVVVDYTEPDIKYTLIGTAGGDDPDTGDIYRGFDRFGRVKDCYWYNYGNSSDVDRIKYGYDRNGNRIWRENVVATSYIAYFDEVYRYDLIDRLKSMERGRLDGSKTGVTNKTFAQCWSLDATGNWRKFLEDSDGDGSWSLEQTRSANKVNEISGITESVGALWVDPVYNRAGNMITIPKPADPTDSFTATYDAWNRLVKLEDGSGTVAQYEYDGAKRRTVKKTYSGGVFEETRHMFYTEPSKWQVVEERLGTSTDAERQFVWGLRYVDDMVEGDRDTDDDGRLDERLYGAQDANWNAIAILLSTGETVERFTYSAYGSALVRTPSFGVRNASDYNWTQLYSGYPLDDESNLYCVRRRYYHLGVSWATRAPIGYASQVALYDYVGNNPQRYVDPFGTQFITPFILEAPPTIPVLPAETMTVPTTPVTTPVPTMPNPLPFPVPAPYPNVEPEGYPSTRTRPRTGRRSGGCCRAHPDWPTCEGDPSYVSAAADFLWLECGSHWRIVQCVYVGPTPGACPDGPGKQYHCTVKDTNLGIVPDPSVYRISVGCCNCCDKKRDSESLDCHRPHWSSRSDGTPPPNCHKGPPMA